MTTLVETIAEFISQTHFTDLPDDVVENARLLLLDSIGCALGGSRQPSIVMLEQFVASSEKGDGNFTVFGSKKKTSLLNAVLLNASRADALEFSDVNKLVGGHPSCMIVPAALNTAEKNQVSGKNLLLAIVLGYEAHRLVIPLYPKAFRDGLHLVMPGGALGACAAAGRILGLNARQLANALGICGAVVPVAPFEPCRVGGYVKDLYTGWSAYTGVFSALLAKTGFTGTPTLFEGDLGLYRVLRAEKNPLTSVEGLSSDWVIRRSCIKLHASCRFTHSSADAALKIAQRTEIRPKEVKKIRIITDTIPYQLNRAFPPNDAIDARFSIPYVVATVLIRKRPIQIDDFDISKIQDEDIAHIAEKVEVHLDKKLDGLYPEPPLGKGFRTAIIEIEFMDGSRISERVDFPKGDPNNPASRMEVMRKFYIQAERVFSPKKMRHIVELVNNIEDINDVRILTSLLRAP